MWVMSYTIQVELKKKKVTVVCCACDYIALRDTATAKWHVHAHDMHDAGWNACSSCHGDPSRARSLLILPGTKSHRVYGMDLF